jgi:hypothetical protein
MANRDAAQSTSKAYRKTPPNSLPTNDHARETLMRIVDRLVKLFPPQIDLHPLDPVVRAVVEVQAKIVDRPSELWRSSKLYRAIDNIESIALHMPRHRGNAVELADLSQELRGLTGWTAAD